MAVNTRALRQCVRSQVYCSRPLRSSGAQCRLTRILLGFVCLSMACACSAMLFLAPAHAEAVGTDIIIEKNLFSPDRKKWVSAPASDKKSADKLAKKEINDLMLMGTAIRGKERYAVLHAKKDAGAAALKPWMKGDYVQGYLLKEIEEKMVVLQDEAENKEYILYLNDEKKERVAEKTAVKTEPAMPAVTDMRGQPPSKRRSARRTTRRPLNQDNMSSAGRGAFGRAVQRGGGVGGAGSFSSETSGPGIQPSEGNDTQGN